MRNLNLSIAFFALLLLSCASQNAIWEKVIEEDSIKAYKEYLEKYPNGIYSETAIDSVYKKSYDEIKDSFDIKELTSFLKYFPSGRNNNTITKRVNSIKFLSEDNLTAYQTSKNETFRNFLSRLPLIDESRRESAKQRCDQTKGQEESFTSCFSPGKNNLYSGESILHEYLYKGEQAWDYEHIQMGLEDKNFQINHSELLKFISDYPSSPLSDISKRFLISDALFDTDFQRVKNYTEEFNINFIFYACQMIKYPTLGPLVRKANLTSCHDSIFLTEYDKLLKFNFRQWQIVDKLQIKEPIRWSSVESTKTGKLLIISGSQIVVWDILTDSFFALDSSKTNILPQIVREDDSGTLIGLKNDSFYKFLDSDWKQISVFKNENMWFRPLIFCLDSNNNLWCPLIKYSDPQYGGFLFGLAKYDGKNWKNFFSTNPIPIGTIITDMKANNGNIWISARSFPTAVDVLSSNFREEMGCLVKFDGNNFLVYNKSNSDLKSFLINGVEFDKQGRMWICSDSSYLTFFDDGKFKSIKVLEYYDEEIVELAIDAFDNIWFRCKTGAIGIFNLNRIRFQ